MNFEQLLVTICPYEKDTIESRKNGTDRMKIFADFWESKGAIVQRKVTPERLADYSLNGNLIDDGKTIPVSMGIQYKTLMGDFPTSINTLSTVLFQTFKYFKDVCLIVEENGGYELLMNEDLSDGLFQNAKVQAITGKSGMITYSQYANFMQSMNMCGVQARAIRGSIHFPMASLACLKYAIKPVHEGLYLM